MFIYVDKKVVKPKKGKQQVDEIQYTKLYKIMILSQTNHNN